MDKGQQLVELTMTNCFQVTIKMAAINKQINKTFLQSYLLPRT